MPDEEMTYSHAQIEERLQQLPGWYYERESIQRVYETDGWPSTLMLVNAIGFCAEAADHHPDLTVKYRSVTVVLSTHSAKGITDKDFELARKFDDVALWRPATGAALKGTSEKFVRSGSRRS